MRKFGLLGALFVVCITLTGVSSCEQKIDGIAGVHAVYDANGNLVMEPDGKTPKVIIDPDSPAAKALANASGSTGPIGWLIGGGGALALTALQEYLKRRLAASLKAEQEAHAVTKGDLADSENAMNATTSGLVSFAKANPTLAPSLMDHIDASHDAHDVSAEHQDAIQSAIVPPGMKAA